MPLHHRQEQPIWYYTLNKHVLSIAKRSFFKKWNFTLDTINLIPQKMHGHQTLKTQKFNLEKNKPILLVSWGAGV